jgi:general stress protein YciG
MSKVREYLAEIGRRGGQAKGPRKARSPEQYREMAKKSAQVRKAKRASDSGSVQRSKK